MDKWIELFKVGEHTDSSGISRSWSESDLDTIVSKYDPSTHEAPVVVGHPKDNAPAYAWVESLKREGTSLWGKFKQVLPEFAEAVAQGSYKKRSIALYPDMTLRHVGFLGAQPPAIKGLKDIAFSESEFSIIEFGEYENKDQKIKQLQEELNATKLAFSQATAQTMSTEEQLALLQQQVDAIKKEARAKEREIFVDSLIAQGKLTPAQRQNAIDVIEICDAVGMYTFCEGEYSATKKAEELLSSFSKVVMFGEMLKNEKNEIDLNDPKAIAAKAVEFKEGKAREGIVVSVSQAVSHITKGV